MAGLVVGIDLSGVVLDQVVLSVTVVVMLINAKNSILLSVFVKDTDPFVVMSRGVVKGLAMILRFVKEVLGEALEAIRECMAFVILSEVLV